MLREQHRQQRNIHDQRRTRGCVRQHHRQYDRGAHHHHSEQHGRYLQSNEHLNCHQRINVRRNDVHPRSRQRFSNGHCLGNHQRNNPHHQLFRQPIDTPKGLGPAAGEQRSEAHGIGDREAAIMIRPINVTPDADASPTALTLPTGLRYRMNQQSHMGISSLLTMRPPYMSSVVILL